MSTIDQQESLPLLITGATGFIGLALCKFLQAAGYQLWVLTRDPARARQLLGADVYVINELAQAKGQAFYAVVNLAGEPLAKQRWNPDVKAKIRNSRIAFTEQLLAFFEQEENFPRVFISGSAVGVYGNSGDRVLTEEAVLGDDFAAYLCRDWERVARQFEDHSTRVCVLRIGIVLEASGGALKQMLPAFRAGLGGRLGYGAQYMSWIHRQDLIRLIHFCLTRQDIAGIFNAVAPHSVSNREFTASLAKTLHRPALFPVPGFVLRLLFGELADALLLSSQRAVPERALAAGFMFNYSNLDEALAATIKK